MTNTLLKLFLPIVFGYLTVKSKYLPESLGKILKSFVVRVTVPALVFMAMYNTDLETLKQLIPVASSYVLLTFILLILSFIVLIGVKDSKLKAAYIITIVWGNYGWMGWAVLKEAFGEEGFSRGVFFTALWWPVLYIGSFLVAKFTKLESKLNIKTYIINMLIPVTSLILGVTLNLAGLELPEFLTYTFKKFGDMTVTIILFSVGLSISFRKSFSNLKLSVVPILLRPVLGIIGGVITVTIIGLSDPVSRSSVLLESTMPVAIFTVVIGDMLGLDEKLMSSILILSTILSLLTIPLSLIVVNYL